jgi:hypothetical protein
MGDPGVRRRLADAVVRHGRLIRWGLAAIGLVWLALIAFGILPYDLQPNDSHAYWVVNLADPYRGARLGGPDAFLYAPVVAQLLGPFTALPFDVFRLGFAALDLVALTLSGLLYTLVIPGVIEDIVRGNIHILLALAILAGFRFPGLWSAVLLTKVSPAIGLVWFAVRREWAALGQVALVTALIVAVSVLLGGIGLWVDWIRLLLTSSENPRTYTYLFGIAPPPLAVRMPVALLVVAWGALNERRWTVPVAAFVALPVIWPSGFALLLAVPPLWFADRHRRLEPIRRAAAAA